MYSPKRTTLKALRTIPTIPTIIGAMFAIATAFSSGRGNTINDFADRLLGAQMGIWAGKLYLQSPTHTIWEGHNGSSARRTGGCDKMPPGKTPVRIEDISNLPARRQ
jgi:hypothetical protein